jgi:predicted site-specific integrase-resolvase
MSGEEKLLTLAEASAMMNKPEVTVKRYARESLIKSVKQGSDLMFPEDAVKKYMEIEKRLG